MGLQHRYWVIGGEYSCLSFREIKEGRPEVFGPYSTQDEARAAWKQLSSEHSSRASVRFGIATEQIMLPAA